MAVLLLILALATFVAWMIARTAHREALIAAAATLIRSTSAGLLSWHRIGWQLLREHRWRIDIRLGLKAIIHDGDALAGA